MIESIMNDYTTLSVTVYGSKLWDMERPDSDVDYHAVVAVDPKFILSGRYASVPKTVKIHETYPGMDKSSLKAFEIGHELELLRKCNQNSIHRILSPLRVKNTGIMNDVRKILLENRTSQIYHSTKGLAHSHIRRFPSFDNARISKVCNIIAREVKFAIRWMDGAPISFDKASGYNECDMEELLRELDECFTSSTLPQRNPSDLFSDTLLELRLDMMHSE